MKKNTGIFLAMAILIFSSASAVSGSNLVGGEIEIAVNAELNETHPKIAFNSTYNEYLVVWWNDRPGCDDIQAQRLTGNGIAEGPPFFIAWAGDCAKEPEDHRYPDVTYNSTRNEYLVVWEKDANTIHARRVSANGILLGSGDIEIYSSLDYMGKPKTDYAYTQDSYLVIWEYMVSGVISDVYGVAGQLVNYDGSLNGSNIGITAGTEDHKSADLAYNRHADRFLVVWQQDVSGLWDIYGQMVRGTGELHGTELVIAHHGVISSMAPAVAAIPTTPTDDKFLVVWHEDYTIVDYDIAGRIIEEDGTLEPRFFLASSIDWESNPQVAGSESNMKYLVTWANPHQSGIFGRSITYDGLGQDEIFRLGGTNAPGNGGIAPGNTGDFLAVWDDDPMGTDDVFGRLIGLRVFLPLILR